MALLSRKKRLFIVKILGLLSIIRWPNVLFTALAQYVSAVYIFTPGKSHWDIIKDPELHLIVAATVFIVAAGFIINSFYDLEKDLINRPHRTLFDRVVSKEFCLTMYFVFNVIGLSFSMLASWRVFLFFLAFTFWLWFYSHKLQKIPIVREFVASILSVISVFSIALYYQHVEWVIILLAATVISLLFNRELIKDLKNLEGDVAVGNQSITTVWGRKASKNIVGLVSTLIVGFSLTFYHMSDGQYTLWYVIFISLFTLLAWGILTTTKGKKSLFWAHRIYKIMLAVGILYLIVM